MSASHLLILITIINNIASNQWFAGNGTFPRSFRRSAVAYDTAGKVWIIGGSTQNNQQLVSFHNDMFTDHSSTNLSIGVAGVGQFYTQIGNILWMIQPMAIPIVGYNLQTLQFELSFDIPTNGVGPSGCLTSWNEYLFLSGGWDVAAGNWHYANFTQIFNISSSEWLMLSKIPQMIQARGDHTCNTNNNKLYVIGGRQTGGSYLNSIEVLALSQFPDLLNVSWNININNLVLAVSSATIRSVVLENDIIISGVNNMIQVIDTLQDTITTTATAIFNTQNRGAPVIIANNVLYQFYEQNWAFSNLSTNNPTPAPTNNPSPAPTDYPSPAPTKSSVVCLQYLYTHKKQIVFSVSDIRSIEYSNGITNI